MKNDKNNFDGYIILMAATAIVIGIFIILSGSGNSGALIAGALLFGSGLISAAIMSKR